MLFRWFLTLAAIAALHAQDQTTGKGVNFYSLEKEQALGADVARTFREQHAALDNTMVRDYIEQMGARLVRCLPRETPFTFHFDVTSDSTGLFLAPASFPGGYIFVPAGLILAVNNEAELAGTIAHSIGHVIARHGTRQATRGQIQELASIPLIFQGGQAGFEAQPSANIFPIGFLQFQRAFEHEADRLAVSISAAAGYDPAGVGSYIGPVQQDPLQPISAVYAAFPNRDDRLRVIEGAIASLAAQTYAASGNFVGIQEEVRRALSRSPASPKAPMLQR